MSDDDNKVVQLPRKGKTNSEPPATTAPVPEPVRRVKQYETDPIPWRGHVDGGETLDRVRDAIQHYTVSPPGVAEVVTLWSVAAHAHRHGLTEFAPRLIVRSPERGSGKSTLLRLISYLVPRPFSVVDPSAASLYHAIERYQPTLFYDEQEHGSVPQRGPLIAVLNAGHMRGAVIPRVIRGELVEYDVFAFAALARNEGSAPLPDTLESRAFPIWMFRRRADEEVARLPMSKAPADLIELQSMLWAWVQRNADAIAGYEPDTAPFKDRDANNAWELLRIAEIAGGHWPQTGRDAIATVLRERPEPSGNSTLLGDLAAIFDDPEHPVVDEVRSEDLATALNRIEDREWRLSPKGLASALKPYGIRPVKMRIGRQAGVRGYHRAMFADAFARYVDRAATSATSATANDGKADVADVAVEITAQAEKTARAVQQDRAILERIKQRTKAAVEPPAIITAQPADAMTPGRLRPEPKPAEACEAPQQPLVAVGLSVPNSRVIEMRGRTYRVCDAWSDNPRIFSRVAAADGWRKTPQHERRLHPTSALFREILARARQLAR